MSRLPPRFQFNRSIRAEWVSFALASMIVGELAALSQLRAAPWSGLCGGLAAAGGLLLAALAPSRRE